MQEQAEGRGEPANVRDGDCGGDCTPRGTDAGRAIGTRSNIPVRRHGTVPPLDDGPVWEQIDPGRARTIAESGGAAVL
ncbi:MAG: hypothetical protein ACHP7E_05710, partial [Burkholderiales bacterium]